MVTLKKRQTKGRPAYYLSHTYRENGKVKYKETYVGENAPKNLEQAKREFLHLIYREKWFDRFDLIKRDYAERQKKVPPSVKANNLEAFAIRFTYDTNRIEGSKLTFRETSALLSEGISPKDKPIADVKEAEAHKRLFYEMLTYDGDLSIGIVLSWHKELFRETKPDLAGKIREYEVYITNSRFRPPDPVEVQAYILEFFRWYSREKHRMNAVELAALSHVKFETIHPFGDGNGRIGRLILNFILQKNGYPMTDIKYQDRIGYYRALERAQLKKDDFIFVQWFFKRYMKENGVKP